MSRLLVISHTPHYMCEDRKIAAWGPTVRELDYLAEAFGELEHVAFFSNEPAPASAIPYESSRVHLTPLEPSGGHGITAKLGIIRKYPSYLNTIREAVSRADVVQIRCPCNLAIPALFYLAAARRGPCWAKYAGNWVQENPPLSYAFQNWWLQKGFHRGPVTINGVWPNQPRHVFSFQNPCMAAEELQAAKKIAREKTLTLPIR